MRLEHCPTKCTAKLRAGECRRVPRAPAPYLAGYYIGCPGCGQPQAVLGDDVEITEKGAGEAIELSVSPVRCGRCSCVFRIDANEITLLGAPAAER